MEGLTIQEMAERLGAKHKTIWARLARAGIKPKQIISGLSLYTEKDFEAIKGKNKRGNPGATK
jgi:predicted DNA-binding protein (UPF0251 family)